MKGDRPTILKLLVQSGDISEENLKKIFKKLSLETHPDTSGRDPADFADLQVEYQEAKTYLAVYRAALKKIGKISASPESVQRAAKDPEKELVESLRRYSAAGMHSTRVRIKPELQERNEIIMKEIGFWSDLYDPKFFQIFQEYNKNVVRSFTEWKAEKKQIEIMDRYFLAGFNAWLDWKQSRAPGSKRIAVSFLKDALFSLTFISPGELRIVIQRLSEWILEDMEKPEK